MTSPRTLLTAWNIRAKKQLGQNFLNDPNVSGAIVDQAGLNRDDVVLEIGPGLGAITIPAARAARRVVAVDKDGRIVGLLQTELTTAGIDNVEIREADILRVDLASVSREAGRPLYSPRRGLRAPPEGSGGGGPPGSRLDRPPRGARAGPSRLARLTPRGRTGRGDRHVSGGLVKIGSLLVAAALVALVLDETEIGRELSLRPWVSPGLMLGAVLVVGGVLLGTLGRVSRRVLPSRCARCGRTVQRGQVYCADHLKLAVDEARDEYHARTYGR